MVRQRMNTRWDEKNVHTQCLKCNHFSEGEQFKMAEHIDEEYGEGTAKLLIVLSKINRKWIKFELEGMIEHYKKKIKEME